VSPGSIARSGTVAAGCSPHHRRGDASTCVVAVAGEQPRGVQQRRAVRVDEVTERRIAHH
jgi:hypothetical protein